MIASLNKTFKKIKPTFCVQNVENCRLGNETTSFTV